MKLKNNQENLHQIGNLVEYAFNKKYDVTKDPNFLARYRHSTGYGIFHDKQLASYVMVNNFKSQIFDKELKMAGVGYVASYPENRGHGDISRIMDELLKDQRDKGVALSNLAPFSEQFYRHFGYENTTYQKIYSFNANATRFLKPFKVGYIKRGKWQDEKIQQTVKDLYYGVLGQGEENNVLLRENWWWERMQTYYPDRSFAIYYDEDNLPQAYLIYQMIDGNFIAQEFIYQNASSAKSLLAFIASHGMSESNFKLIMPIDSLLEELFPEQDILTITKKPYMMSRIIDFKQVSQAMKFNKNGKLVLEVSGDKQISSNNGKWQLSFENNQMTCQKLADGQADYSGDITTWNQVLLGNLSLAQAVKLDKLIQNSKFDVEFIKGKSSFYDYF